MPKFWVSFCAYLLTLFVTMPVVLAQRTETVDISVDFNAQTVPLGKVFVPGVDVSGRGFYRHTERPQGLAAPEVMQAWESEIGWRGFFRLQYNLWEIQELSKDKAAQEKLLASYEEIIKKITDAGGTVILDIFGTPAGMGKAFDKKTPPSDIRAFKAFIKEHIRNLSCIKKYSVWYEVWTAPDLDDFFLGRQQEYLYLYRAIAEVIKELEKESKIQIPLGGPGVSWWFQSLEGNTIITPERSLIYDLIKFCRRYRLPLDFVSWHSYSTDPFIDKEITVYNKTAVALIRDWLSYFDFDKSTPLIVSEWNYDSGANVLPARHERSFVNASYMAARLKNMHEVGIDYQFFYALEDFLNAKEGVIRNVGVFWFDPEYTQYKGGPKSVFNVYKMLRSLEKGMVPSAASKQANDFVDAVVTKTGESLAIIIYNYIDPAFARNYLFRSIASLHPAERKFLVGLVKAERLDAVLERNEDINTLRTTGKLKALLKKAQDMNDRAVKFRETARTVNLTIKNLKDTYAYQRYGIDSSCALNCAFTPFEEKEISAENPYKETLTLQPYSVALIVLKKQKPKPPEQTPQPVSPMVSAQGAVQVQPAEQPVPAAQEPVQPAPPAVAAKESLSPASSVVPVEQKGSEVKKQEE